MRSPTNDLLGDLGSEVRRALRAAVRREVAGVANRAIEQAVARIAPSVRRKMDRAIVKTLDWAMGALGSAIERVHPSTQKRDPAPKHSGRK